MKTQTSYPYTNYTPPANPSTNPMEVPITNASDPVLMHPTPLKEPTKDVFLRNAGATLKGSTVGVFNLISEPFRNAWNYSKEGTPQALTVAVGTLALGYAAVATASTGALFPLIAGGLAFGAGTQLFRGSYGAFSAENKKEQLKGYNRMGQALTLLGLAGVSTLHYKQFFHAPSWEKLLPDLGNGIKEMSGKGFEFVKTIPKKAEKAWVQIKTRAIGVKNKAVAFWDNLKNPKKMG
jgi:hypothetical protein